MRSQQKKIAYNTTLERRTHNTRILTTSWLRLLLAAHYTPLALQRADLAPRAIYTTMRPWGSRMLQMVVSLQPSGPWESPPRGQSAPSV